MIGTALIFIRQHLDAYLRSKLGGSLDDGTPDKVVFVAGDQEATESISFASGAVTLLLVNLEEERILREADPYRRDNGSGGMGSVQPDIRLVLYALFVARFSDYANSWNQLSSIVQYFQHVPVLDRTTAPNLPDGVERLAFELVTQSFSEQNDIWNALRTTHLPSLLYRVKLLTIRDTSDVLLSPISTVKTSLSSVGRS
jgi:hypothetical protein